MPQVAVSDYSGTTVVMNGDATGDHRGTKEDHSVNTDRAESAENRLLGPPSLSSSRCVPRSPAFTSMCIIYMFRYVYIFRIYCSLSKTCVHSGQGCELTLYTA